MYFIILRGLIKSPFNKSSQSQCHSQSKLDREIKVGFIWRGFLINTIKVGTGRSCLAWLSANSNYERNRCSFDCAEHFFFSFIVRQVWKKKIVFIAHLTAREKFKQVKVAKCKADPKIDFRRPTISYFLAAAEKFPTQVRNYSATISKPIKINKKQKQHNTTWIPLDSELN